MRPFLHVFQLVSTSQSGVQALGRWSLSAVVAVAALCSVTSTTITTGFVCGGERGGGVHLSLSLSVPACLSLSLYLSGDILLVCTHHTCIIFQNDESLSDAMCHLDAQSYSDPY